MYRRSIPPVDGIDGVFDGALDGTLDGVLDEVLDGVLAGVLARVVVAGDDPGVVTGGLELGVVGEDEGPEVQ